MKEGLVSYSSAPMSRVHSLVHLETIKARNKPKNPASAPEPAPFLLPTITGLEPQFAAPVDEEDHEDAESSSRVLRTSGIRSETVFMRALRTAAKSGDFSDTYSVLEEMSPSAMDFEIQALTTEADLLLFLKFLGEAASSCWRFDLLQAMLHVFLRVHGDSIVRSDELMGQLRTLQESLDGPWERVESLLHANLCLLTFLSGIRG